MPALIAACTFIESLVVIGALIPTVAILFSLGVTAGTAGSPISLCLLGAYLGAVCGDSISFLLGRYCHAPLLRYPPFTTHPEWIDSSELFFAKHGVIGLVIGRFLGPLRATLPFVAGFLEMPIGTFMITNLLSALAWSPLFIVPGYLVGANITDLLPWHSLYSTLSLTMIEWLLVGVTIVSLLAVYLYFRRKAP